MDRPAARRRIELGERGLERLQARRQREAVGGINLFGSERLMRVGPER